MVIHAADGTSEAGASGRRHEMECRVARFDWAATPLGASDTWPEALRIAVRLILPSPQPMLIWWGPELIQVYNDAYAGIMGADRHPAGLGQPGRECWGEIWDTVGRGVDRVLAGSSVSGEGRLLPVTRNGMREDVWWDYSYSPIEDDGALGGVLVICNDVTARVKAEEHQRLLAREMHHRMKNGLTVIQALVTMTGRSAGSIEDYRDTLAARIKALATTQDLFIQSEGEEIEVCELIHKELAPFLDAEHRVQVNCATMTASSRTASGISLIIHELFTNAVKYGAFSMADGRLVVDCSTVGDDAKLMWRESGCSAVEPVKRGFGTTLIERAAEEMGGAATLEFFPEGLSATISFKLARIDP